MLQEHILLRVPLVVLIAPVIIIVQVQQTKHLVLQEHNTQERKPKLNQVALLVHQVNIQQEEALVLLVVV